MQKAGVSCPLQFNLYAPCEVMEVIMPKSEVLKITSNIQ